MTPSATVSDKAARRLKDHFDRLRAVISSLDISDAERVSIDMEVASLEFTVEAKAKPDESLKALEAAVRNDKKWWIENGMEGSSRNEGRIEAYDFVLKLIAQAKAAQGEPKEMRAE